MKKEKQGTPTQGLSIQWSDYFFLKNEVAFVPAELTPTKTVEIPG